MVQSPGTSRQSSSTAHVMSVVPHSTSTSPVVVGAGHELLGEGIDRAAADERSRAGELVAHSTGGLDARHDVGQPIGRGACFGRQRDDPTR